jgi:hypothetical protein
VKDDNGTLGSVTHHIIETGRDSYRFKYSIGNKKKGKAGKKKKTT